MLKIQICSYSELKQFIFKTWIYMPFDLGWIVTLCWIFQSKRRKTWCPGKGASLSSPRRFSFINRMSFFNGTLFFFLSLSFQVTFSICYWTRILPDNLQSLAKWLLKLICKFFSIKSNSVCNRFNLCLTCWNYNRGRRSWYWGHFPSTYQKT